MEKLNLSSPWVIYYQQINAMFNKDPEVNVVFDEKIPEVKLFVDNQEKADALTKLLPSTKDFGNVCLVIKVFPPANKLEESKADLFRKAFKGNEVVSFIHTVDSIFSNDITYVVFKKEVIQYFTDELSSINGMHSTLYQDIAKDIFDEHEGISFCTNTQ